MRAGDRIRKLTILAKRLHYLYLALTLKFSIIYYTHTPLTICFHHLNFFSFMSNNCTSDKPHWLRRCQCAKLTSTFNWKTDPTTIQNSSSKNAIDVHSLYMRSLKPLSLNCRWQFSHLNAHGGQFLNGKSRYYDVYVDNAIPIKTYFIIKLK